MITKMSAKKELPAFFAAAPFLFFYSVSIDFMDSDVVSFVSV